MFIATHRPIRRNTFAYWFWVSNMLSKQMKLGFKKKKKVKIPPPSLYLSPTQAFPRPYLVPPTFWTSSVSPLVSIATGKPPEPFYPSGYLLSSCSISPSISPFFPQTCRYFCPRSTDINCPQAITPNSLGLTTSLPNMPSFCCRGPSRRPDPVLAPYLVSRPDTLPDRPSRHPYFS